MALAVLALLFGLMVACAAPVSEDDGEDSSSEAITQSCSLSRAQILASVSGGRRVAIERGFRWYDAHVPYSQSRFRDGYRTDCSGFVSMSWSLSKNYTTAYFANGTAQNEILRSYDSLVPADALVRRSGRSGHIVLFVGWNDRAHTQACVIEQNSTRADMKFQVRTTASLRSLGYHATRADRLSATDEATNPEAGDDEGDGDDDEQ